MTREDLQQAAAHLRQSDRGRRALKTLKPVLNDLLGLDSQNMEALLTLISGALDEYPGTVLELLEETR